MFPDNLSLMNINEIKQILNIWKLLIVNPGYYYSDKTFNSFEEALNVLKQILLEQHKLDTVTLNSKNGNAQVTLNSEDDTIRFKADCLVKRNK